MRGKWKYSLFLILALMFSFSTASFASDSVSVVSEEMIQSADTKVTLGNGIGYIGFLSEEPVFTVSGYSTTHDQYEGYFYIESSGEVLGRHKVTVYFDYDGTLVKVKKNNNEYVGTSTWEVKSGYRVDTTDKDSGSVSPTYAYGTATFKLYKTGFFGSDFQNSVTIHIYCNQKGKTTVERNYN